MWLKNTNPLASISFFLTRRPFLVPITHCCYHMYSRRIPLFIASLAAIATSSPASSIPAKYSKLWRDPVVQTQIDRNIEQCRKGNATFDIVDSQGTPAKHALVQVRQTTHEFLFGCDGFVLGQLGTSNQVYEETFAKLFNFWTVPFYWEGTEPTEGKLRLEDLPSNPDIWRRPSPDRYIPFAAKYGITLKGHPLLWHLYNPQWLPKHPETLRTLYTNRFRQIASRYTNSIHIWDGVNESLECNTNYPLYTSDRSYVGWAFKQEAAVFPLACALLINETTSHNFNKSGDKYYSQITKLLAEGARIQGIGFQFHYFSRGALDKYISGSDCNPTNLLRRYEKFGKLDLPLYITEITLGSAGTNGESLQAEVVHDHYRLWFSVPAMRGITWWNLGDGTAVTGEGGANGGLVDEALAPKAAYNALDQLINHDWKTSTQIQTDSEGHGAFRGFFGKYNVTVTSGATVRQFEIIHSRSVGIPHRLVLTN